MANCIYCSMPVEDGHQCHKECHELKSAGWSDMQITQRAAGLPVQGTIPGQAQTQPLTQHDITVGVFRGNLITLGFLVALGLVIGFIKIVAS